MSEKEMSKIMMNITRKMIVWGSDEVIKSLYQIKNFKEGGKSKEADKKIMLTMENIFLAIRKDLGHKNRNITEGKLLALFINDVEKLKE